MHTEKSGIRAPFLGISHGNNSAAPHEPSSSTGTTNYTSSELFGQQTKISILHHGERYQLRITSLGKLILTK